MKRNLYVLITLVAIVAITTPVFGQGAVHREDAAKDTPDYKRIEKIGLDLRYQLPNGPRLTLGAYPSFTGQYDYEGGDGSQTEASIKSEGFLGEGFAKFELGFGPKGKMGRVSIGAFIDSRSAGDEMANYWPLGHGGELPELEPWKRHYVTSGFELALAPVVKDVGFHFYLKVGWRSLGWSYDPVFPAYGLYGVLGMRLAPARFFHFNIWGGTEIGFELEVPLPVSHGVQIGPYVRGNWIPYETWELSTFPDDQKWTRNVYEVEAGLRFNLRSWLMLHAGVRYTRVYGHYPDMRDSYGQRVPAYMLEQWSGILGITFIPF
jgi:opacity protein-like surface antigen